eukprot:COSAG02_NODE_4030_length_5883_cov_9.896266_5_plen_70_part_00
MHKQSVHAECIATLKKHTNYSCSLLHVQQVIPIKQHVSEMEDHSPRNVEFLESEIQARPEKYGWVGAKV